MPSRIKEVELMVNDRVLIFDTEQMTMVKVRVADVLMNGDRVRVTRHADDKGTVFHREQVYPLYRYVTVQTPEGMATGVFPLCAV